MEKPLEMFKLNRADLATDWVLIRTKGYLPGLDWFFGEDFRYKNPYRMKYSELIEEDRIYSYEAYRKNPLLERQRYFRLKNTEKIIWGRKRYKQSQLPESARAYKMFLKKNN